MLEKHFASPPGLSKTKSPIVELARHGTVLACLAEGKLKTGRYNGGGQLVDWAGRDGRVAT